MEIDLDKVDSSALTLWQKFEATNIFILSRLSYLLKSGYVLKGDLNDIDDKMTRLAKKWVSFPSKGASTEPLYIASKEGGLGLFPIRILADTDIQAHKFLSSPDPVHQRSSSSQQSPKTSQPRRASLIPRGSIISFSFQKYY